MSGPAKSGVFIYAKNTELLSKFYTEIIAGAKMVFSNQEMSVISIPDGQLVIHALEPGMAPYVETGHQIKSSAIKPFFTVIDMFEDKKRIEELGGRAEKMIYKGPYFNVSNASDPEGNVFMIREFF